MVPCAWIIMNNVHCSMLVCVSFCFWMSLLQLLGICLPFRTVLYHLSNWGKSCKWFSVLSLISILSIKPYNCLDTGFPEFKGHGPKLLLVSILEVVWFVILALFFYLLLTRLKINGDEKSPKNSQQKIEIPKKNTSSNPSKPPWLWVQNSVSWLGAFVVVFPKPPRN